MSAKSAEGTQGHVSGAHNGQSTDQQPAPAPPPGGKADLANQKVKIISGRYSPKSHLEREGMKKK